MYKSKEQISEKVFESLGMASMCWDELPRGIFESTKCKKIGEELINFIHQIRQDDREELANEVAEIVNAKDGDWETVERIISWINDKYKSLN